jgi:diadenosine tetraphosphate (Ap4A) HIT family hydrolase
MQTTVSPTAWESLARGVNCPFDAPRPTSNEHWDFIAKLSASSFYLSTNQTYRGYSLVVFDTRHVVRIDQLTAMEWSAFAADMRVAHDAIVRVVKPDHMNVELLGNVVSHLHWHLVPRTKEDGRWGAPIWTSTLAEMKHTRLGAGERESLIEQLRGVVD